ncbi:MAG: tetratricopeptide repeat protein [Pseudomonadota bacterium]
MMNNNKRWQTLNRLLAEALEQPAESRDAWIRHACDGDASLEAELRELLAYDPEETGGLSDAIAKASARATDAAIGSLVGAYRVTSKIAEGGMGVVYAGEREGADFEQRVAIKVMHSRSFDEVAEARFLAERQILATLSHPNIASLIDGGVTDDGLPYLVMEYIEGINIADYCVRKQLTNEQILRLVTEVCGALQYAHNQLVIHRDIKPSNILIDASGAPRLLDFGIAKLLPADGGDSQQTRPEWRALTPLYASPEQIGNQPISTAADVYGVGLLLYRLLTGQLPYSPTSDHPRDIEDAILSTPAEAPSSAVTRADGRDDRWLTRQKKALRGDLDTILLKALRKEPERRYATINALSEDIQRYLSQLPIRARRDTLTYRASRFVARNRIAVALATLLIVSAVSLTAFYTVRVNTEREIAEQTANFLTGLFEDSNPYQRSRDQLTVAELVTTGAETVANDASLAPLVRGRLLVTIARVLNNVGQAERAEPMLDEALGLFDRAESPEGHMDAVAVMADVRLFQARYQEGIDLLTSAIEISRRQYGEGSIETGALTCKKAYLHYRDSDYPAMYEQASIVRTIYEEILPEDDLRLNCPYGTLSTYYQVTGQPRVALEFDKRILAVKEAAYGLDDFKIANTAQNIGVNYIDLGDFESAITYLKRAVAIRDSVTDGADRQLPQTMYSLAHALGKLGRFGEAHEMFLKLIDMQYERTGKVHDTVAYWLNGHGDMLANLGSTDEADDAFTRAMSIYETIDKPEGHFDRSVTLVGLGKVARDRGDLDAAEALMREGFEIRVKTITDKHSFTQLARIDWAEVLRRQGRLDEARTEFEGALAMLQSNGNGEHPTAAQALTGLAQIELSESRFDEAEHALARAIEMTAESIGRDHLDNVDRQLLLADVLTAQGDDANALPIRATNRAARAEIMAEWRAALAANPVEL